MQRYSKAEPTLNMHAGGLHKITYQLSEIRLDDYFLTPEILYENDRLSYINFGTEDGTEYDDEEKHLWMEQLADKRNSYQQLQTNQLGVAHKTNLLPSWIYNFEWGRVWSYYDYDQFSILSGILVSYDPLASQG